MQTVTQSQIFSRKKRRSALLLLAAAAVLLRAPEAALAQDNPGAEARKPEELKLTVASSLVLDYAADVARISISNPDVVDAVAVTSREVLLNAKSAGLASLVIWSKSGARRFFSVTVDQNLDPLRRILKDTFPNESMDVRVARDSLALVGQASSQAIADRAAALMAPFMKSVVNNLQVNPPGAEKQILLRVKFAELNRSASTSFGLNLLSTGFLNTPGRISTEQFASGGPSQLTGTLPGKLAGASSNFSLSDVLNIFAFRPDLNLGAAIKALQNEGILQILAEPNLVATNGKEASFLVGGEFPVPVLQGGATAGAVTVQFREFGIRLSFLPVITSRGTIKLHVKPEVSAVDLANGVVFSGFTIPALSTRRVETDIELGEGQSFVIAGLLDDRVTANMARIPGLAHLPILGALFKSKLENKAKTELVIMVTPETLSAGQPNDSVSLPVMPKKFLEPFEAKSPKPSNAEEPDGK